MKKQLLFCLTASVLAGLVSYFAATGQLRRAWSGRVKNEPLIEYPARLDLGKREIGDVAVAHFTIANRGGSELVIDEVRSNCSCTGMERKQDGHYGRVESLRLKAGEQTDLVMRVSVRGVPIGAEMINAVEFRTNDPTQMAGRIEAIVRYVSGGVSATPQSIVFGTVSLGANLRHVVDVYDNALTPRSIERVTSTKPDRVIARLLSGRDRRLPPVSDPPRILIGRIEVIVDSQSAGDVNEAVQIHLIGEPRKPDAITVIGRITAPIGINPSLLVLPRASKMGPIYDGTCICQSSSGQPLFVTAESVPHGLTVETLDAGKASRRVRIKWDPKISKELAGGKRQVIRLRAKSGEQETLLELQLLLRM